MPKIKDYRGLIWDATDSTPTDYGFDLIYGRVKGVRGGRRLITTPELAKYIASHSFASILKSLPISKTTLIRVLADMDEHYHYPNIDLGDKGFKYTPPVAKRGDVLHDVIAGDVIVGGFTNGAYPWVYRKDTGSLILCGELIDAVKTEAAVDIMAWYDQSAATVAKWRKTLGVDRQNNQGTQRLYKELMPIKLTNDVTEKAREKAALPESIEKIRQAKIGKPAHPNTAKALRKAAGKPKSEEWRQKMSDIMRNKNS